MKNLLHCLVFVCMLGKTGFSQNVLDRAGLTAATPSSVAFSLRKLSTNYTGNAIKVRRSSDNAEATIAFDVNNTITAASLATFTPGIVVGASLGTLQTGTITTDVTKSGTITIKVNKTGTITTSSGSLTVTGTGTNFTTELVAGDRLFNGSNNVFLGVVASITNNTTLQLANFSTVTVSNTAFKTTNAVVTGTATNFTTELSAGDRLFNAANTYLGTVTAVINATTLTVNAVDAVAATTAAFKGTTNIITGNGTNFSALLPGTLLISNNTTLGIIATINSATSLTLIAKAGGAVSGSAFKATTGTVPFSTFYAATSVFVNTWYDQSGNGRDAVQLKPSNQPRIVNAGTLHIVNARTSLEFSNSLTAFLQTSTAASYLNNTLYTLNKITAEATITPNLQLPISTTGGSGPSNTISHYGYRSSSQFTVAQYNNDQNFNATPSTSLESHTSVKTSTASSEFYKNGISLGALTSGAPSHLNNIGLLNIGYYTPTLSYYNGSVSELTVFSAALSKADVTLLNDNQMAFYNIATTYWTGAMSTDWANAGNWSTGIIPTITSPAIVVIPAGKPNYPVISGTAPANSISLEAGTSLTVTGTLEIAGTINSLGTVTATSGSIEYKGLAAQSIVANTFSGNTVRNIILNNSTGVTLNGNLTVSNNITFTAGRLSMGSGTLTIGGTVTNTVAGGLSGGSSSNLVINSSVSPTLSFDQTTPGTTNVVKNLTINSSGQIITLSNNLLLHGSGTTTFTAGKLAIGSSTLTIRGAIVNTVNEGLRGSSSSHLIIDGSQSQTISFDQTTPGTTNALNTFTINAPGQTTTLNRPLVVLSSLNLTAGVLADAGNQLTSTGTLNLTAGTIKLGSAVAATTWPAFTTNNIAAGGTVEYAAGVLQAVSATPVYQNLTISAPGGTVAAGDIVVNNVLNLAAPNPSATAGSLSMSTYTLLMGGTATTIGQGDVTGIVKRTTILPNVTYTMGNEFSYITFPNVGTLPSQMSMKITIGSTPSWQPGAVKRVYEFIQTGGTGTKAVINAHYLDGELNGNVENKLVDFSNRFAGPVLTEHGKSNFNTTQNWIALSNVNVAFFSSSFGNVELSFDETALTTLTWNGSTSSSWITATNWTPNGGPSTNTILIIPDAATTPNDPYLPATASNGSVTIENGGIVNADPGAQLTLNNGDLTWSNSGTFNAGNSTVIFTNANAAINGTTNFNNVIINSGAELAMSAGAVMRIAGTITNNGTWRTGLLNNTVEYNGTNQTVITPNGTPLGYYNLIINGSGTTTLPASTLNIVGDLSINSPIITTGNTIIMKGSGAQAINGAVPFTFNNLSINNSTAAVNLNQNVTVNNTLTFTAGKLAIGNNTLTLSGNVVNSVNNGIIGSLGSNLVVNGTVSPSLSFDQTAPGVSNALNTFTINTPGQTPLLTSDVEVNGAMTFTGGKLGINGNTLTLKGAVVNTAAGGLRGSGTSNLIITGGTSSSSLSFDQSVPGATNLLNNLTINNPGQTILLANPLRVAGALDLTDGIVIASFSTLTLTETATIMGGSELSFINGSLTRITNTTGAYRFPVGKINTYRPVEITPVSSATGTYTAEYYPAIPPSGTYQASLIGIATNEYWDINKVSGPDAQVGLTYSGAHTWSTGSPTSMDNIFVAALNGGVWNPANGSTLPGNTGSGNFMLTSTPITTFSAFTFGYSPNAALPLTLISFKGSKASSAIELVWTTTNESAIRGFELERSADGRTFSPLAFVPGTNTSLAKTYNYTDNHPLPGTNYYRLKLIDIDGAFKYSFIIKLDANTTNAISVYPNPVQGNTMMLQLYGQQKGDYRLSLYDINGKKAMAVKVVHDGVNSVKTIPLNTNVLPGVYYLEITNDQQRKKTIKVFIQ